jgi:O-antigen/teichoic acid export membrane protein
MIYKILKNKIFGYIFSRYLIYALQFINTLILAKKLSPQEFGIWSFTQFIILIFLYFDLGIPSSFNAISSIHINRKKIIVCNFHASLTSAFFLSIFVSIIFILNLIFKFDFLVKYNFNEFSFYVFLIIILSYFNNLFINLYRIYNKLKEITFLQSSIQLFMLLTYIVFKKKLIDYLLISIILANAISLVLFIINSPISLKFNLSKKTILKLQKSGLYFFLYNTSFYFILMSTRSIISYFYKVEEFGLFNFALSLAGIVELIIGSFMFLIFPKMINKLSSLNNIEALNIVKHLQNNYNVIMSFMSFIAISFFPIITLIFPNYTNSIIAFNLIIITKLIITNSFGSPEILMSRKKEKSLAIASFFTLIINIIVSILLTCVFHVTYEKVMIGTFISYLIFVIIINKMSLKTLDNYKNFWNLIKYSFPIKTTLPLFLGLIFSIIKIEPIYNLFLILIFIILNYNDIIQLKVTINKIITNPNITDI